ncbi:MAG TPA: hypothetical protein VG943_12900 [Caulobacterales bacterium]|nr:hypothetical protein [Caulobacterales bacterium]
MLVALLVIAVMFVALLAPARLFGVHRNRVARLLARYGLPSALGVVALLLALRGMEWSAAIIAILAFVTWRWPLPSRRADAAPSVDPADIQAQAILGVGATATDAEIRAAFRAKMAAAHPDRGGGHDAAARLVSARDRLLRRR